MPYSLSNRSLILYFVLKGLTCSHRERMSETSTEMNGGTGRQIQRINTEDTEIEAQRSRRMRGLGAAFPLRAAVEPVAHGGEPRGIGVEQGREGEKRRPERR